MTQVLSTLRSAWARVFRRKSGKGLHRQVAVIGLEAGNCDSLAWHFLTGAKEGIASLQSDDIAGVVVPSGQATTDGQERPRLPREFSAVYLLEHGRTILRRWRLYLVSREALGEPAAAAGWKTEADTGLICWPYGLLSGDDSDLHDRIFPIICAVGAARAQGRLRRLAIVITEVPFSEGCNHPSQLRLDLPGRGGAGEEIGRLLDAGNNRPGHELADPRWRQFLFRLFRQNRTFVRLFETCNRTLGKPCPVFFLPAHSAMDGGGARLLAWVDRDRVREKSTSGVWSRLGPAAAVLVFVAVAVLSLTIPMRPAEDAIVAASGDLTKLKLGLDQRLRMYDQSLALACFLRGEANSRGAIAESRHALTLVESAATLERNRVQSAWDLAELLPLGGYGVIQQLDSVIKEETGRISDARCQTLSVGVGPTLLTSWQYAIDRLSLLRDIAQALLPADAEHNRPLFSALRRNGEVALADSLKQWANASDPLEAYDRGLRLADDEVLKRWIEPTGLGVLLAPPSLDAMIEGTLRLPLWRALASDVRTRLRKCLEHTKRSSASGTRESSTRAAAILSLLDTMGGPHEMVLCFTRFGETNWHVDVCESPGTGYVPCQWRNDSCFIRLSRVVIGGQLDLTCNTRSRYHVLGTEAPLSCTPNRPTQLTLRDRSGSLKFTDSDFEVEFTIVRGWPSWPPQMANATGAL